MTEDEMVGWHHRLDGNAAVGRQLLAGRQRWTQRKANRRILQLPPCRHSQFTLWLPVVTACSLGRVLLLHALPRQVLFLFSRSFLSNFCDLMDCSTPGFSALHHLPEFAQTQVH